eukprot:7110804-Prorocentrum_lima.AAC.1
MTSSLVGSEMCIRDRSLLLLLLMLLVVAVVVADAFVVVVVVVVVVAAVPVSYTHLTLPTICSV